MKQAKKLSVILALTLVLSVFSVLFALPTSAAGWDGKTANVKWYVDGVAKSATTFTVKTPAELLGLSYLVGSADAALRPQNTDKGADLDKLYYDASGNLILEGSTANAAGSLDFVTDAFEGKTVELGADIDLAGAPGKEWRPIGGSKASFKGTFDGKNHTIKNLYLDSTKVTMSDRFISVGLFGYFNKATFKNVTLDQVTIMATGGKKGTTADNKATGTLMAGPVVGWSAAATIDKVTINNLVYTYNSTEDGNCDIRGGAIMGMPSPENDSGVGTLTNVKINGFKETQELGSCKLLRSGNKLFGSTASYKNDYLAAEYGNSLTEEYKPATTPGGSPSTADMVSVSVATVLLAGVVTCGFVSSKKRR